MPPPHHHHHLYILQMVKITLVGQPLLKDVFVLFLYLYWYLYLYLYILLLLYLLQVVFVQGDPSTAHCYKLYSRPHPLITLFSVQAGTNSLVCNRILSASRWKFCHCKSYSENLIAGFVKYIVVSLFISDEQWPSDQERKPEVGISADSEI